MIEFRQAMGRLSIAFSLFIFSTGCSVLQTNSDFSSFSSVDERLSGDYVLEESSDSKRTQFTFSLKRQEEGRYQIAMAVELSKKPNGPTISEQVIFSALHVEAGNKVHLFFMEQKEICIASYLEFLVDKKTKVESEYNEMEKTINNQEEFVEQCEKETADQFPGKMQIQVFYEAEPGSFCPVGPETVIKKAENLNYRKNRVKDYHVVYHIDGDPQAVLSAFNALGKAGNTLGAPKNCSAQERFTKR